jgi:transcriptional regulator with XRE-family HTH domain
MTASALAKLLGVTPAAIWMWEKKGSIPRASTINAIAKAFQVTREFLITGKKMNGQKLDGDSIPLAPSEDQPLEQLMRAIEAKGFHVSVRLKTENG